MSDFLENTICQFHQLKTIAVDLNPLIEIEKKQLCAKCLVFRPSSNHQIVLNEEFKAMVKEIKINEYQKQRRIYEESQSNYKELRSKLQNYQDHLNANIKKNLTLIDHYVQDQKKCFEQILEPNDSITQQDLLIFNEKSNSAQSTLKSIQNLIDKDQEFQKLLQDQFRNLHQEDSYLELIKLVDQIKELNQNKEFSLDNYSQYKNQKGSPNLKHQCLKHGKEIVMVVINEKYEQEKLVCIDCIPSITTKLTTLEEANKMWQIHQGEIYESNCEFLNGREQIQQQIQSIISKYQQKERILQNEIIQLIEIQNKDIKNKLADLEQSKDQKQLMQLEQKQIKTVINLLADNDRMSQVKEIQMNLKLKDLKYQKEILKKLNEIEYVQQDCRQEIFKHFEVNDSLLQDTQIQIESFQKEIENQKLDSSLFTNLIPKFENQLKQSLLVLMKEISDKGHQYIQQLNHADFRIKNKEQELMNINQYQDTLRKFDSQYKMMKNDINLEGASPFQTKNNFKVYSLIINISQQIGKLRLLSINTIKTVQFKSKINNLRFQDQLIQANKYLNFNQQLDPVSTKILQQPAISIKQQQQINFSNVSNYVKLLKFSTNLKHSNITISADGKTAKSTSGWYQLCLCDQPIPKDGTVVVDFKVKQLGDLLAGVCLINSINKEYCSSYGFGKGCYFLYGYDSGYIFSHHDKDKDYKKLGFPFYQNDIISMEVNVQQKQITWRNKAKNQVYTLEIQTTSDLYYCFELRGQTEIELL